MLTKLKHLFLLSCLLTTNSYAQLTFQDHIISDNLPTVNGVKSTFAADLDGDGDMDVITAFQYGATIAWHENTNGSGDFEETYIITTDVLGVCSIFAADLDSDGDLDILSASSSGNDHKIAWYENTDGLGDFGDLQLIATDAFNAKSIFASDIDGDGDADVIVGSSADAKVAWYENTNGQGNFSSALTIATDLGANSVFCTDLDGDGDIDVLSTNAGIGTAIWHENTNGLGTFDNHHVITTGSPGLESAYAVDLDGDGDMDVLSASSFVSKIAWYENTDGQGTFGTQQIIATEPYGTQTVYAADIDGDGDMDVLSGTIGDTHMVWYKNENGLGNFEGPQFLTTYPDAPTSVYAVDLDGDGDLDVLSASSADGKIAWYENLNNQGTFGYQQIITTEAAGAHSVYAFDLDGDGDMDVLSAASFFDGQIAWYENLNGLGLFGAQQIISANAPSARSVYAVDLDGDGDADVLSATSSNDQINWFENIDGLGTFDNEQTITSLADGVRSVYAADFDNDGDFDVLSASINDNKIAWYENTDGLGNFGDQQIITTYAGSAKSVHASDLDGDGDMDVLSASSADGKIAWYENLDGQGTFSEQKIISISINTLGAESVYAADMDGDNDLDVLSASSFINDNKIAWYENSDGQGNFGEQQIITTEARGMVHANDIDGDGDMDVLSLSLGDIKLRWHENLGLTSNKIYGFISYDNNTNGCDPSDSPIPNLMVTVENNTDQLATFSLSNGFYQFFPGEGEYTTSVNVPDYFNVNPNSYNSNFTDLGNSELADFCLEPNQSVDDLNISLFPLNEPNPGFEAKYQLIYHNVGTTTLSGQMLLEFDEEKISFLLASEPPSSQTSNSCSFAYDDLAPFESRSINVSFQVLPPPTVNIDELLLFTATINPILNDNTEDDNVFTLEQTVIGSFDPNDIAVLEGSQIFLEDAAGYLHYIIRFQNTGTAPAINVRVNNLLDANLDWQTFQLENTSHNNRVEIQNGYEVDFIFDNIFLADSTSNEPESHGYIAYKIKPKSDVSVGDLISNQADIFFDFNQPIETNIVTTEIIEATSLSIVTSFPFAIYPIPSTNTISITSNTDIARVEIYNQFGHMVLYSSNHSKIDISSLNQGVYFCRVINESGRFGVRKLIKGIENK